MLDANEVQEKLDVIQQTYGQGLIDVEQKLEQMIDLIDAHVASHNAGNRVAHDSICNRSQESQYDKAVNMLRQLKRVDRFTHKLNLYV